MSACEKCWGDAYLRMMTTGKPQSECYTKILEERESDPCTPEEQAGDWWDDELKIDSRTLKYAEE